MSVDIKDFTSVSSLELQDNLLLALANGSHGKITLDLVIKHLTEVSLKGDTGIQGIQGVQGEKGDMPQLIDGGNAFSQY